MLCSNVKSIVHFVTPRPRASKAYHEVERSTRSRPTSPTPKPNVLNKKGPVNLVL
jgi:hypothetical protein